MLAPSGGGLILYQAYGNLYAMTDPGDSIATIKRRRHDIHGDGVRDSTTMSGRGRLKVDLESSTWRHRQKYKATPSQRYLYTYKTDFRVLSGDENPIHTLGDYSKPSHKGYRNYIELPVRNNMVPLRFDIIRLVQNGCSFHKIWSEDPNQHLKDFLKLVDSLDLDGANREERAYVYFYFPFAIKLAIGLNDFQQDPSPHGRILLLISMLNSTRKDNKTSQLYPDVPTTS
ncbi:hypothetical protein Tco_0839780 [Tanacetum coccineum]|uniref:Zinc finger, CCHC-type n=1 Tax=Tanacetum coccineum TaxID=301880 RepID=A0ABQ5ASI3_9ASTR